jgi:hypothetical protein
MTIANPLVLMGLVSMDLVSLDLFSKIHSVAPFEQD